MGAGCCGQTNNKPTEDVRGFAASDAGPIVIMTGDAGAEIFCTGPNSFTAFGHSREGMGSIANTVTVAAAGERNPDKTQVYWVVHK